jgi:hypothetical protein
MTKLGRKGEVTAFLEEVSWVINKGKMPSFHWFTLQPQRMGYNMAA